jgi:Flp pilus assembly protein CpaB
MARSPIAPRLHHRAAALLATPGWRRVAMLRRAAAALLCLLALLLALVPRAGPAGTAVVVAAADLPAGATVRAADLTVRTWPAELVPVGALADAQAADGRVLVGAARAGEAITDVRLVGAGPGPPGAGGAAVPVRLADSGVALLLTPGRRVDVVTVGASTEEPVVLAAGAEVLAVLPEEQAVSGRLVLVALAPVVAARVAAASLTDQVAITLR